MDMKYNKQIIEVLKEKGNNEIDGIYAHHLEIYESKKTMTEYYILCALINGMYDCNAIDEILKDKALEELRQYLD